MIAMTKIAAATVNEVVVPLTGERPDATLRILRSVGGRRICLRVDLDHRPQIIDDGDSRSGLGLSASLVTYFLMRGRTVQVPSLIGKSEATAESVLDDLGLRMKIRNRAHHDKIPENAVTDQSPPLVRRLRPVNSSRQPQPGDGSGILGGQDALSEVDQSENGMAEIAPSVLSARFYAPRRAFSSGRGGRLRSFTSMSWTDISSPILRSPLYRQLDSPGDPPPIDTHLMIEDRTAISAISPRPGEYDLGPPGSHLSPAPHDKLYPPGRLPGGGGSQSEEHR
jgi:hypothetical protein